MLTKRLCESSCIFESQEHGCEFQEISSDVKYLVSSWLSGSEEQLIENRLCSVFYFYNNHHYYHLQRNEQNTVEAAKKEKKN